MGCPNFVHLECEGEGEKGRKSADCLGNLDAGFPNLQTFSLAWPGAITEDATWRQLVKELKSLRLMLYWPLLHVCSSHTLTFFLKEHTSTL